MREIKFRGRRLDNGNFVYGDLLQDAGQFRVGNVFRYDLVEPDSVSQFIGYDVDGNEIYEGDICVEKYYCTYEEKAGLMATFNNFISGDDDQHFSYYKLKGCVKNEKN